MDTTSTLPAGQASPPAKLTGPERTILRDCEFRIERGLKAFYEVGASLLEIRDQQLYRQHYATFEAYCQERWSFSSSRAKQFIAGAKVVDDVKTVTNVTIPNEAIARELNRLPKDQRGGCWQDIVAAAGNADNVTAAKVKQTVDLWCADNEPYRPNGDEDEDESKPAGPKPVLPWDRVAMLLGEFWRPLSELVSLFSGSVQPEDAMRRWLRQPKKKRDRSLGYAGRIYDGTRLLILDAIDVMDRAGKIRQRGEGFDAEYQFINPNLPAVEEVPNDSGHDDDPPADHTAEVAPLPADTLTALRQFQRALQEQLIALSPHVENIPGALDHPTLKPIYAINAQCEELHYGLMIQERRAEEAA